jgi:hypothetical protein
MKKATSYKLQYRLVETPGLLQIPGPRFKMWLYASVVGFF